MASSFFMGELKWKEYERWVAAIPKPILLLPIGALEQHGYHMSMNVDVLLPTAICRRVAEHTESLVAPAIQYGYKSQQKSGGGNHYPGTTSLDGETLTRTVQDFIREVARHGVRNLAIMNGHFENSMFIAEGIDLALRELRSLGITDFRIMVLSYWDFVDDPKIIETLYPTGFPGWSVEHGGIFETSLMMALYPQLVDLDKVVDHQPARFPPYDMFPVVAERTPAPGTLSSAKDASPEKGEIILNACVDGIGDALKKEFGSRH